MQLNHTLHAKKKQNSLRLGVAMYSTKSRNERLSIFVFYDLQIWNVSPPSCLRLDQAQLVRKTYDHSCPDRILAYSRFGLKKTTQLASVSRWKSCQR